MRLSLPTRLTAILGIVELVTWGLVYYVPAIATRAVADSFDTSPAAVLGAFSLALLLTGLASPAMCRWIDRRGGRTPMIAGLLIEAAGLLLMAASPGLLLWYVGWAIAGLGLAAGLYDAAMATAGRLLGAAARPTIVGITMVGGFASTLGWPLGVTLLGWLGWRGMLVAYAALLVAINLPLLLALPRRIPTPPPAPVSAAAAGQATRPGRHLFLCIAAFFTLRSLISTILSVSGLELFVGLGMSTAAAVGFLAVIGPAQVGMRVVQALVGRRWDPVTTACVGAALVPAVALPLVAASGGPLLGVAAAVFVLGYGLSNGIVTVARGVLPLHLFGAAGYATRLGQLALPVVLAQAAAPLLTAPLLQAWPATGVFLLLAAIATAAGLFIAPLAWRRPGQAT